MLPIIGNAHRPNAPNTWPFSQADTFNMSRHHILPYDILRDAWNNLINVFIDTHLGEARVATRQFILLCKYRLPNIENTLDRLRDNDLTVVECNALEETAVWAPWNIVDGPANRSDDPQNAYMDRFTFGVTVEEFARMRVLERLYRALQQFNAIIPSPAPSLRALSDTLSEVRLEIGLVEYPIPFRPQMWEREPDGRWHKRRSGERFLVP